MIYTGRIGGTEAGLPGAHIENFWHSGPVVYQIYPRSYYDHDGRGQGTIRGITEKLDYLKGSQNSLGIDSIWLTPFYSSPMADGGYDVRTYREVDPLFGNNEDLKELIAEAHKRGIKVMTDFVPNHMSIESEWYKEASSSRDNPKSDWFVFRDAKPDGSMPNNWLSEFPHRVYDETTGTWTKQPRSVWQRYVPERDQWLMCTFTDQQADLNWHNAELRKAMKDEIRYLLDMGFDGLRIDMATYIGKRIDKRKRLPDEPPNPDYDPACGDPNKAQLRKYRNSDPSTYVYLSEVADVLKEYKGRFMVTEDYVSREDPVGGYLKYYENVDPQVCAPFGFEYFEFMMGRTARNYKEFCSAFNKALKPGYVPTTAIGNHDQPRTVTRIGWAAARGMAVMQLTLPGIPFIYYGEELGMEDVEIPPDKIQDPYDGRDPARTPMLWTPGKNAGFSSADKTWLPISPDYKTKNVQAQLRDPDSFLTLYQRLLRMRRESPALNRVKPVVLDTGNEDVFGFMRTHGNESLITLINLSDAEADVRLRPNNQIGKVVLSSLTNETDKPVDLAGLSLQPHEAVVIEV